MKSFTIDCPKPQTRSELQVRAESVSYPRRSAWLFALFRRYTRRYLRHHFHAVRVSRAGPVPGLLSGPLVVVANHPSWWDPLVGLVLTEFMHERRIHYSPIDVKGLTQYPFLERLGFFGVEVGTTRGSLAFLRQSQAILSRPESVLWITPQGEFVDPRERPVCLKQGIGRLAYRLSAATTQDQLAEEARRRDPAAFLTVVGGTSGVGGIYDTWRRLHSAIRGESFHPEHRIAKGSPPDLDRFPQGG